jgi:peptide/nickel transport system ATP-binding protein
MVIEESCAFAPRCRFVVERCRAEHPELVAVSNGHDVRCLRADELGIVQSQRSSAALADSGATARGPILAVSELSCTYRGRHDTLAVDGVSLEVAAGETLAVVGESGSGKSTLLRAIAGLHAPESGSVAFRGEALPPRAVKRSRELRQAIQIVFQNPHSSLNPRHTVGGILERPLSLFRPDLGRTARRERVLELLAEMRLDPGVLARYPSQLSGGQKQRVALARAFAVEPVLILCDEVVSALDVSVQASILELLANLARERGTALLFVAHDLAVVRSIADRVCVMRTGRIQEEGATVRVFQQPSHPYTRELLDAVPRPEAAATSARPTEPADLDTSLGRDER